MEQASRPSLKLGDPAPDFALPTVEPAGTASLSDYRGASPVMLVINRGLWCSFCRRHLALLGGTRERLLALGIETLTIMASDANRARLYLRYRPTPVRLALDPALTTHRAYGLVSPPVTPEHARRVEALRMRLEDLALNESDLAALKAAVQAAGKEEPLPAWDFIALQRRLYAYDLSEEEQEQWTRNRGLSTGQFLVDREGIVRWTRVQNMADPPAGLGNYPSDDEFLAAVQALG